ncbi:MAG: DinB family protein [Candidatus Rokubacteria bacterium]|nr:DinB family protein [Candidatus Rokubacteria bacterium]
MALARAEREALIQRYAEGPARLRAALATVPAAALTWRPAPKEWSAHEIVCHCADAETNAYARIRYLVAETEPVIVGYQQAEWAATFDYHGLPLETALATVDAVRAHTTALIRRLPEAAWTRAGRHTESGRYTGEDWLRLYAEHLEVHARQIEGNVAQWRAAQGRVG